METINLLYDNASDHILLNMYRYLRPITMTLTERVRSIHSGPGKFGMHHRRQRVTERDNDSCRWGPVRQVLPRRVYAGFIVNLP